MVAIQVKDLKERADEIVRRLRETGEPVEIVDGGQVVATIVRGERAVDENAVPPLAEADPETMAVWNEIERLIAEIGKQWPAGVSAAEAIRDARRDL